MYEGKRVSGRIALVYQYHVDATVLSIDGKGHINSIAASIVMRGDPRLQESSAAWLRCCSLNSSDFLFDLQYQGSLRSYASAVVLQRGWTHQRGCRCVYVFAVLLEKH